MNLVRAQKMVLVLALLLWGQASIRYTIEDSFGNRFIGSTTITGVSIALLVLSYFAPQHLTKVVATLATIGAIVVCVFVTM